MLYGFRLPWQLDGVERLLGIDILWIILINMGVASATFGDPRFRLPPVGLSLSAKGGPHMGLREREKEGSGPGRRAALEEFLLSD